MSDGEFHSVLRRMTGRPRDRRQAGAAPASGAQSVSLALARAAHALMNLPLRATAVSDGRESLAEVLERLPDRALLALVEGPGGVLGLVALGPQVLAALIEMQTLGRIGKGDVPLRRPTRTDAAMSAEFIDRMLEEVATIGVGTAGSGLVGFRYSSFRDDPRPLGLLLDDVTYRCIRVEADLGPAPARQGQILIVLPLAGEAAGLPKVRTGPALPDAVADPELWAHRLSEAAMPAQVELTAVLQRRAMPISELLGLSPGQLIPLSPDALDGIELLGLDGRPVASGCLGQAQGHRALRLSRIDGVPDDGAAASAPGAESQAAAPAADMASRAPAGAAEGKAPTMPAVAGPVSASGLRVASAG